MKVQFESSMNLLNFLLSKMNMNRKDKDEGSTDDGVVQYSR